MIAIVFFAAMLAALLAAVLAFRRGRSDSVLRALTLRVGVSVLFFALLMLAWWAGWLQLLPISKRLLHSNPWVSAFPGWSIER